MHGAARSSGKGGRQTGEEGKRGPIKEDSLAWEFVPPKLGAASTYGRSVKQPARPCVGLVEPAATLSVNWCPPAI